MDQPFNRFLKDMNYIKIDNCSICLDKQKYNCSIITNCNHIFHKECLKNWIELNDSCPLCRKTNPMQKKKSNRNKHLMIEGYKLLPQDIKENIEYFFDIIGDEDDVIYEFSFINTLMASNVCICINGDNDEKSKASDLIHFSIFRRIREIMIKRASLN